MGTIAGLAGFARTASARLAAATGDERAAMLRAMAGGLEAGVAEVLAANAEDLDAARDVEPAVLDRLRLDEERVRAMADGLRSVADLPDPLGGIEESWERPNGLRIERVRVPMGVIGIIYEGRPNVTADAAGLAIKSGSAVLLRGSRVAERSNASLIAILQAAEGLPPGAIQGVPPTREAATEMMRARGLLDLLIPRGGPGLIEAVVRESRVPVIETGVGNCHVYVDRAADLESALDILVNAKVQRPSVCNAAESFLVHQDVADEFLPKALAALAEHGVTVFGDDEVRRHGDQVRPATDEEYGAEFLDLRISGRVVGSLDEALGHIARYGTRHTEAIVTDDVEAARRFTAEVDAAAVMVNASTRFTDGAEFGFGAEMGISTQKLHARGPMGLPELTTYKYVVRGDGQVRG